MTDPGTRRRGAGHSGAALLACLAGAVLLAGCGGSSGGSSRPASDARQAGTGSAAHISAALRAQELAIHRQVSRSLSHEAGGRYGALPADLANLQQIPANQVLSSSVARPADPIQGIAVRLSLGGARAQAVAVGPHVPVRVQGTFDLHTPAYWTVTFSGVRGAFPLSPGAFSLTDQQGRVLAPKVTSMSGGRLPALVPAGRPYTVKLTSDLISEGDGKLRYAPEAGHLLVEWDFDVETD